MPEAALAVTSGRREVVALPVMEAEGARVTEPVPTGTSMVEFA